MSALSSTASFADTLLAPGKLKRRAAIVMASYFPDVFGGAERQASILAAALGELGVEVEVIAPVHSRRGWLEETAFGRVAHIYTRAQPAKGGRNLASTVSWVLQARSYAQSRPRFDWVYVFHGRLHALAGLEIARLHQAPLFVKLGGQGEGSDFAALRAKRLGYGRWTLRRLLDRASGFVANSPEIEQDLRDEGIEPDRIIALPNGVVLPPLEALARRERREGQARIVYCGRFFPDKRIDVLVEATALARAQGADVRLTLVGAGPQEPALRELANTLGVEAQVSFAGVVADPLPALLDNEFFASASLREGQSNALIEALASGAVPIAAPASGVRQLLAASGAGVVCEHGTAEEFAAAFTWAAHSTLAERTLWSQAVRRFADANLGIAGVARRTVAAFEARTGR